MHYAVIVTERDAIERTPDSPIHWLNRFTLVRVLNDKPDSLGLHVVETMYPVFSNIPELTSSPPRYEIMVQHVRGVDLMRLPEYAGPCIEAFAEMFQRTREFFAIV